MTKHLPALVVVGLLASGCNEFPCEDDATVHRIAPIEFSYNERVRYTYWFEDGAQRTTFERDQIPMNGRGAVLVHVEGKTSGGLNGAAGWAADVTNDEGARASYVPMAMPRAAAHSAWSGSWMSSWVSTRTGVLVEEIATAAEAKEAVEQAVDPEADPLDPEVLLRNLKAGGEDDKIKPPPKATGAPTNLQDALRNQGISLDGLKLGRALRVVGARQPLPRDFGLSVEVYPTWVFVTQDCDACDKATDWLDEQGIGYHAMLVSDPTNAATLRSLSTRAGADNYAVPTLWKHGQLIRGFDPAVWGHEVKP